MILDNDFPPDPRVENEASALLNEDHTVHLYCIDYTHAQKEYEVINGIRVHRARLPKHLYKFSALAYSIPYYHIQLCRSIRKFIKANKIEALHIHDIQIARSVFWANKMFNLPVTLDLHENRPEIMKHYAHTNSFLGKLLISPLKWKKHEFKAIQTADKVITVTDEAKQYYLEKIPVGPDKFHTVPNTVRKKFYTSYDVNNAIVKKYQNNFALLYLGDTGIRRGLITAIGSLKYLIPKIPDIKIVIVGKSKQDKLLKEFVVENNYEKYVDFIGWVDVSLFQSFIIATDIGICPIHKNIHHNTTYANKIFQYMAFGRPIIVSDCKSQQRVVQKYECGLVFKDRDMKDFADKVITLAMNSDKYKEMSKNAEAAIKEELNWEEQSQELIEIYEDEENFQ